MNIAMTKPERRRKEACISVFDGQECAILCAIAHRRGLKPLADFGGCWRLAIRCGTMAPPSNGFPAGLCDNEPRVRRRWPPSDSNYQRPGGDLNGSFAACDGRIQGHGLHAFFGRPDGGADTG